MESWKLRKISQKVFDALMRWYSRCIHVEEYSKSVMETLILQHVTKRDVFIEVTHVNGSLQKKLVNYYWIEVIAGI